MTKEEIKAEIEKLETEAKQLIANANVVHGALQMAHKVLNSLHLVEQKEVVKVAEAVDKKAEEIIKNDTPSTTG